MDLLFEEYTLKNFLGGPAMIDHRLEVQQKHINSNVNQNSVIRQTLLSRLVVVYGQEISENLVSLTTENHDGCLIAGDAGLQNKVSNLYP